MHDTSKKHQNIPSSLSYTDYQWKLELGWEWERNESKYESLFFGIPFLLRCIK